MAKIGDSISLSEGLVSPAERSWKRLLNGLPTFLAIWQGHTRQTVTLQQRRDLYYLFSVWRQQDDLPVDLKSYGLRIRPLLCRDPDQQKQFLALWAKHWDLLSDTKTHEVDDGKAQQQLRQQARQLLAQQASGTSASEQKSKPQRKQGFALLLLLAVLASLLYRQFYYQPELVKPVEPPTSFVQPDTKTKVKNKPTANVAFRPYLSQIPLRQLPPLYAVEQPLQIAEYWLAAIASALLLLPLAWIWHRRRVQFRRGQAASSKDLPLRAPRAGFAPLLGADAKSLFGRLRFASNGERRIDWRQTVRAIAQSAGLPQLRYRQRQRQADFVLIADRRHRDDQSAWLLTQLLDSLKQAQIRVHRYHFDHHPEWLWRDRQEHLRPEPLAQVLWLHPGSRVLLVAEHEVMFYRLTGELQGWLQAFKSVAEYRLALTTRPDARQLDRLQLAHYRFSVIDKLTDLTPLLDFATATHIPETSDPDDAPANFQREWLGNLAPREPKQTLDWLEQSYGAEVRRFLRLLAVYPGLQGDLSRALFDYAAIVGKGFAPGTLLTVLGLPWCRQGWLPRWLRQVLLDEIPHDDRQVVRRFFLKLFSGKQRLGHIVQLQLQKPPGWRQLWLRYWWQRGGLGSPWRDGIFAEILLLPRWQWLEQILPRRLLAALPNLLLGVWLQRLAMLALIAVYAAGVTMAWQTYGRHWAGQYWLAEHRAANSNITVTIVHHPGAQAAALALGEGLAAMGYQISRVSDATVEGNRIDAPAPQLNELRDIAQHMTWGSEFDLGSDVASPQIYLAAMPQTGQVFRDWSPVARVTTAYPPQLKWQTAPDFKPLDPRTPVIDWSVKPIIPKMVPIPGGQYQMGSPAKEKWRNGDEGPQHIVNIAAFQLAEAELTFAEWDQCVAAKACRRVDDQGWGRGSRPVINVSWDDAQIYIHWLNQSLSLSGTLSYRLPSEAEWEYAARAGTSTAYFWGKASQCDYANGADQMLKKDKDLSWGDSWTYADCSDGYAPTAPVKNYRANQFKLYDMSGNVWEWVQDCHHDSYKGAPDDGRAWQEDGCQNRVLRGGSWDNWPSNLRSAIRLRDRPVDSNVNTGFRLARTR